MPVTVPSSPSSGATAAITTMAAPKRSMAGVCRRMASAPRSSSRLASAGPIGSIAAITAGADPRWSRTYASAPSQSPRSSSAIALATAAWPRPASARLATRSAARPTAAKPRTMITAPTMPPAATVEARVFSGASSIRLPLSSKTNIPKGSGRCPFDRARAVASPWVSRSCSLPSPTGRSAPERGPTPKAAMRPTRTIWPVTFDPSSRKYAPASVRTVPAIRTASAPDRYSEARISACASVVSASAASRSREAEA